MKKIIPFSAVLCVFLSLFILTGCGKPDLLEESMAILDSYEIEYNSGIPTDFKSKKAIQAILPDGNTENDEAPLTFLEVHKLRDSSKATLNYAERLNGFAGTERRLSLIDGIFDNEGEIVNIKEEDYQCHIYYLPSDEGEQVNRLCLARSGKYIIYYSLSEDKYGPLIKELDALFAQSREEK